VSGLDLDLRVVTLPGSLAASFCGSLLAAVGAHVVKVEPPGGEAMRADPALFAAVNGGVSSRVIDPYDIGALDAVVADADLVVVGGDGLYGATRAVDRWTVADPSLVVTWVSPFGRSGPLAGWASSDLVQLAMSLWLQATGRPERSPLALGGRFAEMVPGLCAASASLMALRARSVTGSGQVVDVSQQEALLLAQPYFELGVAYTGVERSRNGMPFPMTIVPAADGYLGVNVLTQTQWELLCAYTGRVDLLDDPRFATPADRAPHAAELTTLFAEWAADKPKAETFVDAQEWRIPFGYVPHIDEVTSMAQHLGRSFFTTVAGPGGTTLDVPTVPFLVDGGRHPGVAAPGVGEERPGIWAGSVPGRDPSRLPGRFPPGDDPRPDGGSGRVAALDGGPLTGVRVVDLSMFWSGPLAADLLAQYGADVVKVESVQRVDGWRGLAGNTGIEGSNLFNGVNLNKSAVTLDLTSAEGRDLLRPLVAAADVLIENFSPRVMGNFGLTDDVLHGWNPDLVIMSMPAFGLTGPWGGFVGFAPTIEQLSGLPELTGYPDGPPALSGNSLADPCAGLAGCFAVLATLQAGRRGSHIDLSQLEALTGLLAPDLLHQQLTGAALPRHGASGIGVAPQGIYPSVGTDRWIVLGATDDAEWTALATVAALGWATDERFTSPADRLANATALDGEIAAWTAQHDNTTLAARLQAAGVAAAPVLTPAHLDDDGHLLARGSRIEMSRDHVPDARYTVLPFKFPATPGVVHRPGPTLGQDNDAVLGGRLGLSPEQLDALRAARVIGETIEM
jgi:crotonobetainyl-CoA:carnitine CoA-transferase CaiB-like acyl-CoA transferase